MASVAIQGNYTEAPAIRTDFWLCFAVISLICLGTVMVFSSTISEDPDTLSLNFSKLNRHIIHLALGLTMMWMVSRISLYWLERMSQPILILCCILLLLLFVPGLGAKINGSTRWYNIGGLRLQPAEFVKLGVLIYMAGYLARKQEDLHLFKVGIVYVGLVIGLIGGLLLMQPDYGTLVVIMATVIGLLFLAGVRLWHFMLCIGVAGGLMGLLLVNAPYRLRRLMSFRDPWADAENAGYQLVQALIAIGRGEWFGTGLGSSLQKLFYLPHANNDFLIAIVGEELGAVGIFCVIALFITFFLRAFHIAFIAYGQGNRFSAHVAQAVGLLFAIQACIHIGVNTGSLPTKGLTLPLMSYGGSSLLSSLVAVGLLLAVDRQNQMPAKERNKYLWGNAS